MKKITILLLVLIHLKQIAPAQVIINLQLPQAGISIKSQLWNMTLTNAGTSPVKIRLSMVLTDLSTGQQVLSGASKVFQLQQGSKIIQYTDVIPVQYTVLSTNYNVDMSPNGFLPVGNFNVCYEVLRQSGEIFESMAEECAAIEVEPVSPPFLNSPDDRAEINEQRPLFTWLPPSPLSLFNNLSYDLNLVEVFPSQNSASAVQQNFPMAVQKNIYGLSFQYPLSGTVLDTGKTYAWQITAKNNNRPVAVSDVWTFKIKFPGNSDALIQNETPYFKLQTNATSAYFVCDGLLKFEYTNEVNDSTASFSVYDITSQNKKMMLLDNNRLNLRLGQNLIDIDLKNTKGFVNGHYYVIELVNSKQETWNGRFEYKTIQ